MRPLMLLKDQTLCGGPITWTGLHDPCGSLPVFLHPFRMFGDSEIEFGAERAVRMSPWVALGSSWSLGWDLGSCASDNVWFVLGKPEVDTQITGMVNKEEDRLLLRNKLNSLVKRSQLEKMPF